MKIIYNNNTNECLFYIDPTVEKETYEHGDDIIDSETSIGLICGVGKALRYSSITPVVSWNYPKTMIADEWKITENNLVYPKLEKVERSFLEAHTKAQLLELHDEYGISGYSDMDIKEELITAIIE